MEGETGETVVRGRGEARDGRGGMGGARAEASCCGRSRGRALQVEWEGQYPVAMACVASGEGSASIGMDVAMYGPLRKGWQGEICRGLECGRVLRGLVEVGLSNPHRKTF